MALFRSVGYERCEHGTASVLKPLNKQCNNPSLHQKSHSDNCQLVTSTNANFLGFSIESCCDPSLKQIFPIWAQTKNDTDFSEAPNFRQPRISEKLLQSRRPHDNMVVSQNTGTPIWTPKYYSPYHRDPQKSTPNYGKPPILKLRRIPPTGLGFRV